MAIPNLANTYASGLNPIVAALAAIDSPTLNDLNTALINYIQPLYYSGTPPLDQQQKLNAVMGNIFNTYIQPENSARQFYSPMQLEIIEDIIEGIENVPLSGLALDNFFTVTEESVAMCGLTAQEQAPILMALAIAEAAVGYFIPQILSPSTDWATYFDPVQAVNLINCRYWLSAIFAGALIGATQSIPVVPADAPNGTGIGNNIITTIAGALTTTFGKIIFQWTKKSTVRCNPVIQ
jgi:hypothetical protein